MSLCINNPKDFKIKIVNYLQINLLEYNLLTIINKSQFTGWHLLLSKKHKLFLKNKFLRDTARQ